MLLITGRINGVGIRLWRRQGRFWARNVVPSMLLGTNSSKIMKMQHDGKKDSFLTESSSKHRLYSNIALLSP
jgi:hypothetical protein